MWARKVGFVIVPVVGWLLLLVVVGHNYGHFPIVLQWKLIFWNHGSGGTIVWLREKMC